MNSDIFEKGKKSSEKQKNYRTTNYRTNDKSVCRRAHYPLSYVNRPVNYRLCKQIPRY